MKFICENCKAKYQIGDDKIAGRSVRMKCRRCGHLIQLSASVTDSSASAADAPAPELVDSFVESGSSASISVASLLGGLVSPEALASQDSIDEDATRVVVAPGASSLRAGGATAPRVGSTGAGGGVGAGGAGAHPAPRTGIAPAAPRPGIAGASGAGVSAGGAAGGGATAVGAVGGAAGGGAAAGLRPGVGGPVAGRMGAAAPGVGARGAPATGVAGAFQKSVGAAPGATGAGIAEPRPAGVAASVRIPHGEDWYVGVGGVPLGPVRLAIIREKALAGAVHGDSLVWREGFDEWQPLKNFPELLEILEEAQATRGASGARRPSVVPPRAPGPPGVPASAPKPAGTGVTAPSLGAKAAAPAPFQPRATAIGVGIPAVSLPGKTPLASSASPGSPLAARPAGALPGAAGAHAPGAPGTHGAATSPVSGAHGPGAPAHALGAPGAHGAATSPVAGAHGPGAHALGAPGAHGAPSAPGAHGVAAHALGGSPQGLASTAGEPVAPATGTGGGSAARTPFVPPVAGSGALKAGAHVEATRPSTSYARASEPGVRPSEARGSSPEAASFTPSAPPQAPISGAGAAAPVSGVGFAAPVSGGQAAVDVAPPSVAPSVAPVAVVGSAAAGALDVMRDPFAGPTSVVPGAGVRPSVAGPESEPPLSIAGVRSPRRGGMHPVAYAFIAMAAAFGAVVAYMLFSRPPQQVVIVQPGPGVGTGTAAPAGSGAPDAVPAATVVEVASADPSGTAPRVPGGPLGTGGKATPTAVASGTSAPLDTSGFGNQVVPLPTAPTTATGPDPSLGQLTAGEIQGVVASNQPRVRKRCWQPALDSAAAGASPNARVNGRITIGASGGVESASASGSEKDFPGLSSCVAGQMKGWKFPPSGGSTPVNVPFVFAGQ